MALIGIKYGEPSFKPLNSTTYLRTRNYVWTGDGSRGIEECLVQENKSSVLNLGRYKQHQKDSLRINSEDIMVIYTLDNDLLEIQAVIDLNELEELVLTKGEQLKYFKTCCAAQIPPKDDLDIEVLNNTDNSSKKRVFYKNY